MDTSYPTKGELRCTGCSLIISQILLSAATMLHAIDFSVYDVDNADDVISLHETISSEAHKVEIETAVSLIWLSFPFLLIALYGLKHSLSFWTQGTTMWILSYIFEKAYLLWMSVMMIVIPALSLVSVSYDWSFHGSTTFGYYVQCYMVLFELELFDCVHIADAVFVISIFLAAFILNYGANTGNKRWSEYIRLISGVDNSMIQWGGLFTNCVCIFIMFLIFVIILFEFAESGFHSPTGNGKIVLIMVFLCKIYLGIWTIIQSRPGVYEKLKRLAESKMEEEEDKQNALGTQDSQTYQMEQVDTKTP